MLRFMFITVLLALALGVGCGNASAQASDVVMRRLIGFAESGMVMRKGIAVDANGFIWLSGTDRIIRQDGTGTRVFPLAPEDIDHQVACYIVALSIGRDGTVWGASRRGIVKLAPGDSHLRFALTDRDSFMETEGVLGGPVTDIALDPADTLWFVSDNGLYRLPAGAAQPELMTFPAGQLQGYDVRFPVSVDASSDGTMWVVFRSGLVIRRRPEADSFLFSYIDRFAGAPDRMSIAVSRCLDADRVLIGTPVGLHEVDLAESLWMPIRGASPPLEFTGSNRARDVIVARDGRYWIATAGQGLVRLDRSTGHARHYRFDPLRPTSLSSDRLRSLAESPSGGIWIGTAAGYCLLESTDDFEFIAIPPPDSDAARIYVPGVTVDHRGRVWLLRYRSPLLIIDPATGGTTVVEEARTLCPDTPTNVYLATDADGSVWGAARGSGIYRFDAEGRPSQIAGSQSPDSGLRSLQITSFALDHHGHALVGHDQGIDRFDLATGRFSPVQIPNLGDRDASTRRAMVAGRGDTMWISTGAPVILELRADEPKVLIHPLVRASKETPLPFVIRGIHELEDGRLMLAARNGLFIWDPVTDLAALVPETQAATHSSAIDVIADDAGALWIPTPWNGLLRFDPNTGNLRVHRPENSFGELEFAPDLNCMIVNGRIYLVTNRGILHFHPDEIGPPPAPLPPRIIAIRVMGEERKVDLAQPSVAITDDRNVVSIDFVSPSGRSSDGIEYRYRIQGLDSKWTDIGDRRSIDIVNLPSGRFEFQLEAISTAGGGHAQAAPLSLVVELPAWRRPFVRGLALLVILLALGLVVYLRLRQVDRHTRALQSEIDQREASEAERLSLEGQLLHALKLEAVGKLAGGVAHDFNNILTAVIGHAEMMRSGLNSGASREQLGEDLEYLLVASDRAVRLTQQLLTFGRRERLSPSLIDPGPVLDAMVAMLERLVREDIRLVVRRDQDLGRIMADAVQIEQIILNLVVNAVDAMPDGGQLEVEMTVMPTTETGHRRNSPIGFEAASGALCLRVRDTGRGMTEEVRRRIFEPYFTTKAMGEGSGLGLSTVYGIVRQMNGLINVHSEVLKGTTFELLLPRDAQESVIPERLQGGAEPVDRSRPLVLVCEQSSELRALTCRILELAGFRALEAAHPRALLALAETLDEIPMVLLVDEKLQGMDGRDLSLRMRERFPDLRVVVITEESTAAFVGGVDLTGEVVLSKPYESQGIIDRVRGLLGQS